MSEPMPAARTVCAHVALDFVATNLGDAIEKLAVGFGNLPGAKAPRTLAALALEREAQASTYLGHATALPHARIIGLPHLAVTFGRARAPIPWTREGDPVDLVFFGLVPAEQPRHYLEFMRRLSRSLTDPDHAAALRGAADEAAVRAWLRHHLLLQ